MAWTSWGFDGTINESQWAQMAGLLGNGYVALNSTSCVVTPVAGARSVSVSAGTLFGDGVVSVNSGAETVAMTTPVNGQWFVIALRRTWATNTVALVAIAGATTTTTTPTAPPTTLPTLNTDTGVLTDQPIAWAWCNSANTTVVVFDMRQFPVRTMPPSVPNQATRDGKFTSPTQGMTIWRDDLGAAETYYGLYNVTTNPGGRDVAGWYTDTRAMGLVPIKANSATIVTGTGTTNSLGQVTFSGATKVILNGIFTDTYRNYKIIMTFTSTSVNVHNYRFTQSGTEITTSSYMYVTDEVGYTSTYTAKQLASSGHTAAEFGYGSNLQRASFIADVTEPYQAFHTQVVSMGGYGPTKNTHRGVMLTNASVDGISIFPSTGTFSGTIQVFGYND